jgi:hypothetical protein
MDASHASFQARLQSFQGAAATKTRRTSKTKKAPAKSKNAWPLKAPSAQDLAYAGFVWKPTSASPDNVQCFSCNCQLDGWEESDVPAYEHLTHSPSCGFAIVTCIRLRDGDPGRTEEDPSSEAMLKARLATFGNMWPLDTNAGYPSVEQMAAAGWYYDPMEDAPDGVTCPYCSLSLDAWDAGDDPTEEHRRRSQDCLFFALTELYNKPPAPKKGKRASTSSTKATTKAKRASSRASTASTKKSTRGKKRASDDIESDFSEIVQPVPKKTRSTRGSTLGSTTITDSTFSFIQPKKVTRKKNVEPESEALPEPPRGKKRNSVAMEEPEPSEAVHPTPKRMRSFSMSSLPDDLPVGTPKKTPSGYKETAFTMSSLPPDLPVGTPKKTPSGLKESAFTMSSLPPDLPVGTPKKTPSGLKESMVPSFKMSSFPDDLPVGTPKKTPSGYKESAFEMSSFPADLLVGTPKKTPSGMREADGTHDTGTWQPTDIDAFFADNTDLRGFLNDIVIDGGLDGIAGNGSPEAIHAAVSAGLTDAEKAMTIEQWVLYNAKRGAEKLRMACEQQISAFEAEGRRALAMLESMPTC